MIDTRLTADLRYLKKRLLKVDMPEDAEVAAEAADTIDRQEAELRRWASTGITQHDTIDALTKERDELRSLLKDVEEWWLDEGMKHFNGAPACMFRTRAALARKEVG